MRKFLIYFPIIFIAIVFQKSLIPIIFNNFWLPDVVLMMILAWALVDGFEEFLSWAVFAGILYDLASFSTVGINTIAFVLSAYGVGFFSRRISIESRGTGWILSAFLVLAATLGAKTITSFVWVRGMFEKDFPAGAMLLFKTLIFTLVINIIFFFLWFAIINKVEEFFYLKRKNKIIV